MIQLIAFDRRFQVWSYTVSHKQLLLRSTKTETAATRIDVLFKNVARINLPTLVDQLVIAALEREEYPEGLNVGAQTMLERNVYSVCGRDWDGYIVAGTVVWAEDDHDFHHPSSLLQLPGHTG